MGKSWVSWQPGQDRAAPGATDSAPVPPGYGSIIQGRPSERWRSSRGDRWEKGQVTLLLALLEQGHKAHRQSLTSALIPPSHTYASDMHAVHAHTHT